MSDRVIFQGANPHGPALYGRGPKTIHAWGCGLTALTEAVRLLGVDPMRSVLEVQQRAFESDPLSFVENAQGQSIGNFERIGAANGLVVGERVEGDAAMRECIGKTLDDGGLVMLHVDKTADGIGDHWILAVRLERGVIIYRDPATARQTSLSWHTLAGTSMWAGHEKRYRVVGVRPIKRA